MKKLALATLFILPTIGHANDLYVSLKVAQSSEETIERDGAQGNELSGLDFDSGAGYSISFGNFFTENISVEIDYTNISKDANKVNIASGSSLSATGDIEEESIGVNGKFHFKEMANFTPYLGLGISYIDSSWKKVSSQNLVLDSSDSSLAYSLLAGVTYPISSNFLVSFDYKYQTIDSYDVSGNDAVPVSMESERFSQHLYGIGLSMSF